jgi:hypothetical protein
MESLDELKRRLTSLQKSPIFAKPAAAEEALICAVKVLDEMNARFNHLVEVLEFQGVVMTLNEKGAGDGGKD